MLYAKHSIKRDRVPYNMSSLLQPTKEFKEFEEFKACIRKRCSPGVHSIIDEPVLKGPSTENP